MGINEIITKLSIHSPVVPLIVSIVLIIGKRLSKKLVPIVILIGISFISDKLSVLFASAYENNMPLFHIYVFFETILILLFFKNIFKNKKIVIVIGTGLILFILFNSIFIENIFTFNTLARLVQSLVMISLSMVYLYDMFKYDNDIFIERNGMFWIVIAILIYFSGAFFSFLLYYKMSKTSPTGGIWIYHNMANSIKNLFFALGLWIARKY